VSCFTNQGAPATSLSPTITVRKVSDGSVVVNAQAMTEIGNGWYKYSYAGYDETLDYTFMCDGTSGLPAMERYSFGCSEEFGDVNQILTDTAAMTVGVNISSIGSAVGLSTQQKADVNTEIVDVLKTDTISELTAAVPPATPTFEQALMYWYMQWRNATETTSIIHRVKNDSGSVICKASLSDDGSTFTKGEYQSGP
jgi:hypothetical protein